MMKKYTQGIVKTVRNQRNENDINKVIQTLKTVMSNPFDEDAYREDVPLTNLAPGVVMPESNLLILIV